MAYYNNNNGEYYQNNREHYGGNRQYKDYNNSTGYDNRHYLNNNYQEPPTNYNYNNYNYNNGNTYYEESGYASPISPTTYPSSPTLNTSNVTNYRENPSSALSPTSPIYNNGNHSDYYYNERERSPTETLAYHNQFKSKPLTATHSSTPMVYNNHDDYNNEGASSMEKLAHQDQYAPKAPSTYGDVDSFSNKELLYQNQDEQKSKHGGLMKFLCCGSRKSCAKTCAITCCVIVLIIIGIVVAIFLLKKDPNIEFLGIGPPLNNAEPYVEYPGKGFDYSFSLNIRVSNPNIIGATFEMIKAEAFYPGVNQTSIGGGNLTNVNIGAKSNTTIQFPFSINYSIEKDPDLRIILDIAQKCGLTGAQSTKQKIQINYTLNLTLKVLFFPVHLPSFQKTAEIDCPLKDGQLPNIPGLNLGGLGKTIAGNHKRNVPMTTVN